MGIILKAENISKQYRLGLVGTGTLGHDLNRWWHGIRGKEDPYLKIGEANDRSKSSTSEYVWALRSINFEVHEGEVLGIIGKNGAGKSTLLKILSRVTSPTTGEIKTKGRIASLLEVGTGFHPELTGRENIYLNGAILGMNKAEIKAKEDEIIDFSGCAGYIDTPVKRYSSGMHVRLAFAVAAHLEPDILVIDEVLAVGDAEFQQKAIGKMQDISSSQGRTVLFVSHNMAAVKNLCGRVIVLQNGESVFEGNPSKSIEYYLKDNVNVQTTHFINQSVNNVESDILEVSITNEIGQPTKCFSFDQKIYLQFMISAKRRKWDRLYLGFRVFDHQERLIFLSQVKFSEYAQVGKISKIRVQIPDSILVPSTYKVSVGIYIPNVEWVNYYNHIVHFTIEETGSNFFMYKGTDFGCVMINCGWQSEGLG